MRSKTAMQLKAVRQEEKESGTKQRPPSVIFTLAVTGPPSRVSYEHQGALP
jgi:hypothetical protein